jgi:hypothetical protein
VTDQSCGDQATAPTVLLVAGIHELAETRPDCRRAPSKTPHCVLCRRPGFFIDPRASTYAAPPNERCRTHLH